MPSFCSCGVKNNVNHALSCKLGGYVIMRHNLLRDLEADFLKEICKDVQIEPQLLPVQMTDISSRNTGDQSRLDISAVGVWSPHERTFLDVRVFHPNSPSYLDKNLNTLYNQNEKEKKRMYNERILNVEKSSFTPLVFSTFGGMGDETKKYHRRIASLISAKTNQEYAEVIEYMRTRIRFNLLKSILVSLRGIRGKRRNASRELSDVSFNLIPNMPDYDGH